MKQKTPITQVIPLEIAGSTKFGIYPKISAEQTFNMFLSNGWMINFAGYKKVIEIIEGGEGRGMYASQRYNHIILVVNNGVYVVNNSIAAELVAEIDTFSNIVYMDENERGEIAICDLRNIYIFNQITGTLNKAILNTGFVPGYIAYHDSRFISVNRNSAEWRLSDPADSTVWPTTAGYVGTFNTQADILTAAFPVPGKANLLFVVGKNITEPWIDVGAQLFPYQKNSTFNIPYGAIPSTIARGNEIVAWLGLNADSGISIMYSEGGEAQTISDDGINYKLELLENPEDSYGFLFMQNGHLFYVLTFTKDNYTLAYDFEDHRFYTLTDEDGNYFIAKNVVYFNNTYYFLSFRDGNLYELNSEYTKYDYGNDNIAEIPRIRICPNIRLQENSPYIINQVGFTIEQGYAEETSAVDFSMSKDGAQSFSSNVRKELYLVGKRQNIFREWNLGQTNEFTAQIRFWGLNRFVVNNGYMSIYQ